MSRPSGGWDNPPGSGYPQPPGYGSMFPGGPPSGMPGGEVPGGYPGGGGTAGYPGGGMPGGFPDVGGGPPGGFPGAGGGPPGGFPGAGGGPPGGFPGAGGGPPGGYPGAGVGPQGGYPGAGVGPQGGYPGAGVGPQGVYLGAGGGPQGGFPGAGGGPQGGFPGAGGGPPGGFPGAGGGPPGGFPGAGGGPPGGFPGSGGGPPGGFPGAGGGPLDVFPGSGGGGYPGRGGHPGGFAVGGHQGGYPASAPHGGYPGGLPGGAAGPGGYPGASGHGGGSWDPGSVPPPRYPGSSQYSQGYGVPAFGGYSSVEYPGPVSQGSTPESTPPTPFSAYGHGRQPASQYGTRSSSVRKTHGTIRPYPHFDALQDAQALRKAMKGWGTDENTIIDVLCNRSSEQRVQIVAAYKQAVGRDLIADVKSELRGRLEGVMVGLLYPMHEYLATELRKAIKGLGTDEDCLIEILCTRSNADINAIKQSYHQMFQRDLESDVIGDTSGAFRRVLVSMCNGARQENMLLDPERAKADAAMLQQAGVMKWGTDESAFNQILATQSYEQLLLVFREYNVLTNQTILETIGREMSGDLRQAFYAIVKCVYNVPYYFAEKLSRAMKGMGTDNSALIRIVVSRCEEDMVEIKEEYERNFKVALETAIQSDTSGDYRKALLALVIGNCV